MKKLKNIIGISFLSLVLGVLPLQGSQGVQSAEIAVEQVDKKMSLLDQIMQQVQITITSEDKTTRQQAKKELTRLMKHKDLDATIKKAIESDIKVIKNPLTRSESDAAYQRLLSTYKKVNARANIVDATVEATEMVQNASPEDLEETIAQAKQKIEEAEQEEQGFMARMYTKAKRFVTAPVDYVFGKEASYAKTAFYAAVGFAVAAAGAYVYKTYGKKDDLFHGDIYGETSAIPSEQGLAELKQLGDTPELQEKAVNQQFNNLANQDQQLKSRNEYLSQEFTRLAKIKDEVKQGKRWFSGSAEYLEERLLKIKGEFHLNEERQGKIKGQMNHLWYLSEQLKTIQKNPSEYGYSVQKENQ